MTVYHGPGRTLPESSASGAGFLQETANEANKNVGFVTAAQVQAALAQITAIQEAAAGNQFTGQVFAITQSTTAKPGGVYIASAGATLTMPSAAAAVTISGFANRQVTAIMIAASGSLTVHAADNINGAANSVLSSQYTHERYDTDGSHWYKA